MMILMACGLTTFGIGLALPSDRFLCTADCLTALKWLFAVVSIVYLCLASCVGFAWLQAEDSVRFPTTPGKDAHVTTEPVC